MMNTCSSHGDSLFRIICPTDRLQPVTRIAVHGSQIRIDTSSFSLHQSSDRVIAISPSDYSKDDSSSLSPAQSALLRVFDRILFNEGGEKDFNEREMVAAKLLAPNSQVGCILGKGGKIVERMRHESGAYIRVFGKDQSFYVTNSNDELIHISGTYSSVKKALILISTCLQDHPASSHPRVFWEQEIVYRMLCPSERVRGIIGKGGATVRGLQSETGACIKVIDPVYDYDSEEKIIVISAIENSEMRHSPSQEAVVRVHSKLSENGIFLDSDSDSVCARLLIPAQQMGALVGKGGTFLREIGKSTGANLRIFYKDQLPRCAHPNDELLQVTGSIQSVHEALIQITGRIQELIFPKRIINSLNVDNNTSHVGPTNTTIDHQVKNNSGNSVITDENKGSVINPNCVQTEVCIPVEYLTFVNGDDGSDLFEIKQISGTNITIEDPKPGEITGQVIIQGTSAQTKTALSLIHGLIYYGVFNPS